jgi:putative ATP-dependent endonuclease of OLD family
MTSWISGTRAAGALRTGQGYAHALYLATVLAELEAARESDLTLLLIDGPEAHLHPLLSGMLLKHLQEAAQASRRRDQQDPALPAGHVQVVVSTRDLVVLNRQGQQPVRAVAVGDLEIGSRELRRLDRYLSVSKSSLLYGAPVLLVATTAEALLLSVLADLVLTARTGSRLVMTCPGSGWRP